MPPVSVCAKIVQSVDFQSVMKLVCALFVQSVDFQPVMKSAVVALLRMLAAGTFSKARLD